MDRITFDPDQCGGRPCIRGMGFGLKTSWICLLAGSARRRSSPIFRILRGRILRGRISGLLLRSPRKRRTIRFWSPQLGENSDRRAIASRSQDYLGPGRARSAPCCRCRFTQCQRRGGVGLRRHRRRDHPYQRRGLRGPPFTCASRSDYYLAASSETALEPLWRAG